MSVNDGGTDFVARLTEIAASTEELDYDIHFPMSRKTDRVSEQILAMDPEAAVQWEEKKEKK